MDSEARKGGRGGGGEGGRNSKQAHEKFPSIHAMERARVDATKKAFVLSGNAFLMAECEAQGRGEVFQGASCGIDAGEIEGFRAMELKLFGNGRQGQFVIFDEGGRVELIKEFAPVRKSRWMGV